MARDRPSPYVRRHRLYLESRPEQRRNLARSAGACPPRSLNQTKNARDPKDSGHFLGRPRHGEGQALALRSRAPLAWRGTGPRPTFASTPLISSGETSRPRSLLRPVLNDRGMARDRFSHCPTGAYTLRAYRPEEAFPHCTNIGWRTRFSNPANLANLVNPAPDRSRVRG